MPSTIHARAIIVTNISQRSRTFAPARGAVAANGGDGGTNSRVNALAATPAGRNVRLNIETKITPDAPADTVDAATFARLVVAAVRGGLLSLDEACERYRLTSEEFLTWQKSIDQHGLAGLRTTRIQQYR